MNPFVYDIPTKVYFGENQLNHIGSEVSALGKNALLVYGGGSVKKTGLFDRITSYLSENDISVTELGGVEPNPKISSVRAGVKLCREHSIDVVLAVGGGSVLDCAKYIAIASCYDGDPWDLLSKKAPVDSCLPVVTVLTMAATGSEMDPFAVLSNPETNEKLNLVRPAIRPKVSFLDPTLTYSVGKYQTACGCADIFSHALETYFNKDSMFMMQSFLEGLMKTVVIYAPIALEQPDNYEARANIMWAASWAINGFARNLQACSWSCHPMEHELSAFYDITHGLGLAILTPRWLKFINTPERSAMIYHLGEQVFDVAKGMNDSDGADATIRAVEKWLTETLGLASTLTAIGIGEEHIPEMARKAVANGLCRAYVPMTSEETERLYRACL